MYLSGIIGLRPFEHLLACGFDRQSDLCISHRDQIAKLLTPNLKRLTQYAFITSVQLIAADHSSPNLFYLLVPCLPRGALLEIVPHYGAHEPNSTLERQLRIWKSDKEMMEELESLFEREENSVFQILFYKRENRDLVLDEKYREKVAYTRKWSNISSFRQF